MQTRMFCLWDDKARVFFPPVCLSHVGQAVRWVIDLAADRSSIVARHPNDFSLFEIGCFDDQTGVVTPAAPVSHGLIASFLPEAKLPGDLFRAVEEKEG